MHCNVFTNRQSKHLVEETGCVFPMPATLWGNPGSSNRLWAQITRVPAVTAVKKSNWYLLNSVEAFVFWMRKREKNGVRLE